MAANLKSDVNAKKAFVEELLRRGYEDVKITGSPADITARIGPNLFYFEVKYTAQESHYFGAATLTEWQEALANENRYWFVVALQRSGSWQFHEYSPTEFMEFSYIPPFKVFFQVGVADGKAIAAKRGKKRVQLTRERATQMNELYQRFRAT